MQTRPLGIPGQTHVQGPRLLQSRHTLDRPRRHRERRLTGRRWRAGGERRGGERRRDDTYLAEASWWNWKYKESSINQDTQREKIYESVCSPLTAQ